MSLPRKIQEDQAAVAILPRKGERVASLGGTTSLKKKWHIAESKDGKWGEAEF